MKQIMRTIVTCTLLAAMGIGCQTTARSSGEKMIEEARAQGPVSTAPTTVRSAPATTVAANGLSTQPTTLAATAPAVAVRLAPGADEASRVRSWNPTVSYYANGNVIAGPVYRLTPAPPKTEGYWDVASNEALQTVAAAGQLAVTPLWVFVTPPWTAVEYHGEEYPPSYSLNDPLPYYVDEKVAGSVKLKK